MPVFIVDNRTFLFGLDDLYRESMKQYEEGTLLDCAEEVAAQLKVGPANVPIEGYYTETEALTRYFRLVRALQATPPFRAGEISSLESYARLQDLLGSPLFGPRPGPSSLLPSRIDSLASALLKTAPEDWQLEGLVDLAFQFSNESDDISLVGLASLAQDPVVLASLRETVALYAVAAGCAMEREPPVYEWRVDPAIEGRANALVAEFNRLIPYPLPEPSPSNAATFYNASNPYGVVGRCIRIGYDPQAEPVRHYHWAVDLDSRGQLSARDFWDEEFWTTAMYRERHP